MLTKLDHILTHITYIHQQVDKKNPKKVMINLNYLRSLLRDIKYKKIPTEVFN